MFSLTLAVLLLTGIEIVPAGAVKGVLVDKNDQPVSDISLKLLIVANQDVNKLDLEASKHAVSTDENGNFTFTDVESNKYVIVVLNFSFVLGQPPRFDLSQQVLRYNNGEVLIFEYERSKGIDLGKIIWVK